MRTDRPRGDAPPPERRAPSVIQVITHLALGGAEEVAISLAEALHDRVDFTFFVVQGGPRSEIGRDFYLRLQACGIPVHFGTALPMKAGGSVVAGWHLRRLIRRTRPDLVHLHTEIPEMTFACASTLGLPRDLRVVRTIHNTSLWPAWARVGAWAERRLRGAHVIAVSRGGMTGLDRFQEAYRIPRAERLNEVIYAGVSRHRGPPAPTRPPRSPAAPVRVLFAGRLETQKGVDLMPAIVERAAALTARPVELHIAGTGTFERDLRTWVETQPTTWTVTMGPPIPNLATWLREGHHDLLFMPSRFEGLSLVAVESLLAGVPIVATRIDGLMEIFEGDYPLLARSEDVEDLARVLAHTVNDVDAAIEHAAVQQRWVAQRFDHEAMGQRYLDAYGRALAAPMT